MKSNNREFPKGRDRMALLGRTEISSQPILKELADNQANKHDASFRKFLQECWDVANKTQKVNNTRVLSLLG